MSNIIAKFPTGDLRQVKRDSGRLTSLVLQQKFKVVKELNGKVENSTEWRDVPTINEAENES